MAATSPHPTRDRPTRDGPTRDRGAREHAAPRRRADAQRSIAAILDAALECFTANPDVSMTTIARTAGVGRVTLYTHFPSREELLEAVVGHAVERAGRALESEPVDDLPARDAFVRLIQSSWRLLADAGGLFTAVLRDLGLARVRESHRAVLDRFEGLIARGQREGAFRTDLPLDWLVTTFYTLLHTAAGEVDAGRLDPDAAADVLTATLLSAFAPAGPR